MLDNWITTIFRRVVGEGKQPSYNTLGTRRNRPERRSSRGVGLGQNIMVKLCDGVPASESDLFRSVRLEPRLILFLGSETGGLSTAAADATAAAAFAAIDLSEFPVLANDDESDLDMVRRVPTIFGNTAVSLIRLLDKNPPPPPPLLPGPDPPPAGGSMAGSSSKPHGDRRSYIGVYCESCARGRTHTSHVTLQSRNDIVCRRSHWSQL